MSNGVSRWRLAIYLVAPLAIAGVVIVVTSPALKTLGYVLFFGALAVYLVARIMLIVRGRR